MVIECLVTRNQTKRWFALTAGPVELEKEIWFTKRFKNEIGLDFVPYRSQNLTQPILKSVFKPNFQALTMRDTHLNSIGRNTIVGPNLTWPMQTPPYNRTVAGT